MKYHLLLTTPTFNRSLTQHTDRNYFLSLQTFVYIVVRLKNRLGG